MIRCIAVDDSPNALEVIRIHASRVPFLDFVGSFRSPMEALAFLGANDVDLIFLDVSMPEIQGTELARLVPEGVMVVFTTAYPEYAVEGFELDAVDYLCKPIEFKRFLRAATRAQRQHAVPAEDKATVQVRSGTRVHRLPVTDILYLKSDGSYVQFVTRRGKVMALMSMGTALELLPADSFVRIHRSFSVAWKHVEVAEAEGVRIGKETIPVGRTYRAAFARRIAKGDDR